MPKERWHVVLNYTCIFFVIMYELLFGETGLRAPGSLCSDTLGRTRAGDVFGQRAERFLPGLTYSPYHPFHMQQSHGTDSWRPEQPSSTITCPQAMVALATSTSCVGRARAVKGYSSNAADLALKNREYTKTF